MADQQKYGSLKPQGYIPRIVDSKIASLLKIFGAVEIRGTKWCGKTWSSLAAAESSILLDLPETQALIEADPQLALIGEYPRVIDEWQEVPAIWDVARHEIDRVAKGHGMFILTGSSTPAKDAVRHSGAGRIAHVDMGTLTLWESGFSEGMVSLADLFDGIFEPCTVQRRGLDFFAERICAGGWPELMDLDVASSEEVVAHYLDALFEVSVPKKGGNEQTARRIALSLARNILSSATYKTLAKDSFADMSALGAESTVVSYLDLFKSLFVLEELPGWDAPVRARSRVRTKPKRYFADPSIAASLLNISPERLLTDGQLMGLLFESLCVHDLRIFTSALPNSTAGSLRYYQDSDGLEIDMIIELRDGRWAGIEVKLGENKVPEALKSLGRLRKKVANNPAARNPEPVFMAVLTATSTIARYDHQHNAYVIPITALRP